MRKRKLRDIYDVITRYESDKIAGITNYNEKTPPNQIAKINCMLILSAARQSGLRYTFYKKFLAKHKQNNKRQKAPPAKQPITL